MAGIDARQRLLRRGPAGLRGARPPAAPEPDEPDRLGSVARSMLELQRSAGNAAVLTALSATTDGAPPALQRQPTRKKRKATPAWLKDAQQELGKLFPKDKLMKHVVVKDYGELNAKLQTIDYGAWTQSPTEIYIRDPTAVVDPSVPATKLWPAMIVRYLLRHEAAHIRQFAASGGPPATWEKMLEHEKEAYSADVAWLATKDAAAAIPDPDLLTQLQAGAAKTLATVEKVLDEIKPLKAPKREQHAHKRMKKLELIPAGAALDPRALYKQP